MSIEHAQAVGEYTAEQALHDPWQGKIEIVDGEPRYMSPSLWGHALICRRIERALVAMIGDNEELEITGDPATFVLRKDPTLMYTPDVAVLRKRSGMKMNDWLRFAPEVVIEVLSASNTVVEMDRKRADFFAYGTEQFWKVNPMLRSVEIDFFDGRHQLTGFPHVVQGEGILEGIELPLEKIFALPKLPGEEG